MENDEETELTGTSCAEEKNVMKGYRAVEFAGSYFSCSGTPQERIAVINRLSR